MLNLNIWWIEGAFEQDINWEDELSLGEKQRLAIARLVPSSKIAILDECTSGVPTKMEIKLYRLLNATYILYNYIASANARKNALQIITCWG